MAIIPFTEEVFLNFYYFITDEWEILISFFSTIFSSSVKLFSFSFGKGTIFLEKLSYLNLNNATWVLVKQGKD